MDLFTLNKDLVKLTFEYTTVGEKKNMNVIIVFYVFIAWSVKIYNTLKKSNFSKVMVIKYFWDLNHIS